MYWIILTLLVVALVFVVYKYRAVIKGDAVKEADAFKHSAAEAEKDVLKEYEKFKSKF